MKYLSLLILITLTSCKKTTPTQTQETSTAIPVTVSAEGMTRGGKPFFVKGAGGDKNLAELAARGANSIRTWSTDNIGEILDEAHSHGLTVSVGIWLEYEIDWFSYRNPDHTAKQTERVRKIVLEHRDHPALLAWGLGNEIEGRTNTDPALWKQLDRLALMIRELDPNHPTYTAIAGFAPFKLQAFDEHAPNLHFLGINTYGGAAIVRQELKKHGLKRPWMLTEWGTRGPWESPKTSFKVNIEPTSCEKADFFRKTYRQVITPTDGLLGSYAFVWSWKHEATSSWFGLLTYEGNTTTMVDALEELWTGKKPSNQAPTVTQISGVPPEAIKPGKSFQANATASDPDNDPITYKWLVLPELFEKEHHTSSQFHPEIPNLIDDPDAPIINVTAPASPGIYRLYLWASDKHGHTATANMPFLVQ